MPYKDKQKQKEYQRKYSVEHREKNRAKVNANQRKYNKKESVRKYQREYHKKYNKEHGEEYRKNNKDKLDKKYKSWKEKNPNYVRDYKKNRKIKDKNFFIKERLRSSLRGLFRRYVQENKKSDSEGYGINFLKIIEFLKPFPDNLENYEIHHIKPLCSFSFVNSDGSINLEEIKKAFAPENHKLLTIEEHKKIHNRGGNSHA